MPSAPVQWRQQRKATIRESPVGYQPRLDKTLTTPKLIHPGTPDSWRNFLVRSALCPKDVDSEEANRDGFAGVFAEILEWQARQQQPDTSDDTPTNT